MAGRSVCTSGSVAQLVAVKGSFMIDLTGALNDPTDTTVRYATLASPLFAKLG